MLKAAPGAGIREATPVTGVVGGVAPTAEFVVSLPTWVARHGVARHGDTRLLLVESHEASAASHAGDGGFEISQLVCTLPPGRMTS